MRPIYLAGIPVSLIAFGWVAMEYGKAVAMVEAGAKLATVGVDLMFGVGCFYIGLFVGYAEKSKTAGDGE